MRILSVVMINVFLITTTGYTASAHYCKGEMYSFALFGAAKQCPMALQQPTQDHSCCHSKKEDPNKCCHDQEIVVQGMEVDGETLNITNVVPVSQELLFVMLPRPEQITLTTTDLHQFISSKSPPGITPTNSSMLLSRIQVYRL